MNNRTTTDYLYIGVCITFLLIFFQSVTTLFFQNLPSVQKADAAPLVLEKVVYVSTDSRIQKLQQYLTLNNSPLAPYAELIIKESDQHDIGWTRLVAISKMESSFGVRIPPGSHNAWGIMGRNGVRRFESWEQGIKEASRLLGENYTYNANRGIQQKYCPDSDGCNTAWASIVTDTTHEILNTN